MLLACAVSAGCGWIGSAGDAVDDVTVVAVRSDLEVWVPARGYLTALNASPVAVPRMPTGALKIKEVAPEGSLVEEGDVIVVFDSTQLSIDLDNHKASFRSAERRIDGNGLQSSIEARNLEVMREVAQIERDNSEVFRIADEEIFSRQEILETEVKLHEAAETIVFADASLLLRGEYYDIEERILDVEKGQVQGKIERVETSLGSLVLKAPIGGLIIYKKNWMGASVGVGDTIWPGNVLMSIVDPEDTALTAFLLEKDAAGVVKGTPATITVDARPDRTFHGQVHTFAEISRTVERGSPVKYTEIKIQIDDGDAGLLKPGMKGEARLTLGTLEDVVVVPRSAVRGDTENAYLLISGPTGPERRAVSLGMGDLVQVSIDEGLLGGERILLGDEPEGLRVDPAPESGGVIAAGG